jgi:type IV pilus assembly protein PilN
MRNLDGSEWLASPNLSEVKAVSSGGVDQANVFTLSVQQVSPVVAGEEEGKK